MVYVLTHDWYVLIFAGKHLSIYLSTYLSISLSVSLSIYLSIYLFIYLSIHVPIHLSIHSSSFHLSICLWNLSVLIVSQRIAGAAAGSHGCAINQAKSILDVCGSLGSKHFVTCVNIYIYITSLSFLKPSTYGPGNPKDRIWQGRPNWSTHIHTYIHIYIYNFCTYHDLFVF